MTESRRPALELLAQLVWIVGTAATYFAAAAWSPGVGFGVLGATFALTLVAAWGAIGGKAVPRVGIALAIQAPLLVGLGDYLLHDTLEGPEYPCFFFRGTSLQQVITFALVAAAAGALGSLLRSSDRGVGTLGSFASLAAPVVAVAALGLGILGAVRLASRPTPGGYVRSLPVLAKIPSPRGAPCVPIENKRDPRHDSGGDVPQCATPEFEVGPLRFHYHARMRDGAGSSYELRYRSGDDVDRHTATWLSSRSGGELEVRRDPALGLYVLLRDDGDVTAIGPNGPRWALWISELRGRVSTPASFFWLDVVGLVLALACFGVRAALGEVGPQNSESAAPWISARRGDLAILALAFAACGAALLFGAVVTRFLF